MKKWDKKLDTSSKLLATFYSLLTAVPIYILLGSFYYEDFISGFLFLGILLAFSLIATVFLIIFRKNQFTSLHLFLTTVLLLLFVGFEFKLLDYESHSYMANGLAEPFELLEDSGIYVLAVKLYPIHYIPEEEVARDVLEQNKIEIINLYKITNRNRYFSKTSEIKGVFGLYKSDFQIMGENVNAYVDEDIVFINEFLESENFSGNSAGLALGLTAMVHQGQLENEVNIGVTGTLEPNGDVMEIGGVKEKIISSEQKGLPFIFVPLANIEEAETVKFQEKLTIEILSVKHIDEAVLAIKELNAR